MKIVIFIVVLVLLVLMSFVRSRRLTAWGGKTTATVNIDAVEAALGMTGIALEKAGYRDARNRVKESFAAECTVCCVKISGADILSEQHLLLRRQAKEEAVLIYRGPDALAWENLDRNKCVKPGCNSTKYHLSWTDSKTKHIFHSVVSRFNEV